MGLGLTEGLGSAGGAPRAGDVPDLHDVTAGQQEPDLAVRAATTQASGKKLELRIRAAMAAPATD